MEHAKERRKVYFRVSYLLVLFVLIALLTVAGFYNGVFIGLVLNQLVYVFAAIDLIIIGYIYKLVMDEEKLEKPTAA